MERSDQVTFKKKKKEFDEDCDLTLILEGVHFPCHRNVLIHWGGNYFSALLLNNFLENSMNVIELKGLPSQGFNEILNYIYAREIYVTREIVYGLLILSDHFLFSELKNVCINFICSEPIIDNVLEIYSFAFLTNDKKLLNSIRGHLLKTFEKLITTENFLNLRFDVLQSMYQEKNLISLGNEIILLNTAVNWYRHDEQNRAHVLDQIPGLIMNISKVHTPFMRNLLANHELFQSKHVDDLNIQESKHEPLVSSDLKKLHLITSKGEIVRSKSIEMIMSGSELSLIPSIQMTGRIMVNTIDDMVFICEIAYARSGIFGLNPYDDLKYPICISIPHFIRSDGFLVKSNLHLLSSINRVGTPLPCGEVDLFDFDFGSNNWSHIFTSPPGFEQKSVIANNNIIYFFGDEKTGKQFGFIDYRERIFHPLCSTFSSRYNAASCIYEKKLYLSGGTISDKSMEMFDMAANKWYKICNVMPPLLDYKLHIAENTVHLYGGLSPETTPRANFIPSPLYDPWYDTPRSNFIPSPLYDPWYDTQRANFIPSPLYGPGYDTPRANFIPSSLYGPGYDTPRANFIPSSLYDPGYERKGPKYIYRLPLSILSIDYNRDDIWEKIIINTVFDEIVHDSYVM